MRYMYTIYVNVISYNKYFVHKIICISLPRFDCSNILQKTKQQRQLSSDFCQNFTDTDLHEDVQVNIKFNAILNFSYWAMPSTKFSSHTHRQKETFKKLSSLEVEMLYKNNIFFYLCCKKEKKIFNYKYINNNER